MKYLCNALWGVLATFLLALPAEADVPQQNARQQHGKKYSEWSSMRLLPTTQASSDRANSRRAGTTGEVVDEHGIIVQPAEGQSKTYERTGQGMFGEDYGDGMFLAFEAQDGTIEIVECSDGTVYFKDLIYHFQRGYWVKGVRDGSKITVAANQTLFYSETYDASVVLGWAHGTSQSTIEPDDTHGDTFTFTIGDDGCLTLEGTSEFLIGHENYFMGTFWSDNREFATYGDALTVYRPINIVTQVDVLPYVNDFSTLGDQKSFTVVDANDDNSQWYAYDGKYSHFSSFDNDNDDWLISPAIRLEAGKNYRVAFDTWKNVPDMPKLIELKMGKAADPEELTLQAIAPTEVEGPAPQTLENERLRVDETGYYYFGIHDISEAASYSLFADNFIVEEGAADDAPAAISDLTVVQDPDALKATITFTAPTTAFDGSTLATNLTKIEVMRDGTVIETLTDVAPGTRQEATDEVESIGRHTYSAVAYNENGRGRQGQAVTFFYTEAQDIPYIVDFTDPAVMDVLNIIDANGDGNTWEWNNFQNSLIYPPSYNADADDYMVVMPVRAKAGHNYKVTFTAHTEYIAERFEVLAGRQGTPDALTISVIPPTPFQADEPTDFEGYFTAGEDGLYFVAIHCISDMYNFDLFADRLVIENGADIAAPAAVSDLSVVAGELGAKLADISFTAPAKTVGGADLTENLTKIELLCDGEVAATVEDVEPGQAVVMEVAVVKPGYYTYQAVATNASGTGIPGNRVKQWIGQDAPGSFYGVQATDNGNSVDFSWAMVTEGANGYYLNPDDVEYQILATEFNGWSYDYTDVVASVKGQDHLSLEFNTDEGEQQFTTWGVKPVNEAGEGYPVGVTLLTGAPYTLPYTESAENGDVASLWQVDEDGGTLYVVGDASDEDGFGMALTTTWFTGEHSITSGKLAMQNAKSPTLCFDVKAKGITTLQVRGAKLGGESTLLQEVPVSGEWTTVTVALDDLKDARYARLTFAADFANPSTEDWMTGMVTEWGDAVFIDNIRVTDDITDGISTTSDDRETMAGEKAYNLNGQHVAKPAKGLYIMGGRKVVIR